MIENDYTSSTIEVDGKKVPKSRSEWDERDFSFANLNSKAISCIINELSCNEFHKVMNITCAKKMWNYLEVTHEGTNEIKNSKINMLTQDFESIRLLPNESIDEFLNKFKSITKNLQSFRKVISCFEMNNKVLRSLPMKYNSIINPI